MGGYRLVQPPERIRITKVVRTLEGLFFSFAGEGRRRDLYAPEKACPTKPLWERLERKFWEALEEVPLADVLGADLRMPL
ncbi:MAG: Rrf2 family transcriptional regulator [Candidatus Bathyarchaeia archaeon]